MTERKSVKTKNLKVCFISDIGNDDSLVFNLVKWGYAPICSHTDGRIWQNIDYELLSRCDLIVMMKGWENCDEAVMENRLAHELDLPIYFWEYAEDRAKLKRGVA